MPNKTISYFLFTTLVISGLFACKQNLFYESNLEIPEQIWENDKAAVFDFLINDTSEVYNLIISLSYTSDYRNSNLWLFVYTSLGNSQIAGDTLEYTLSNEKGKWIGKEKSDSWHNDFVYKSGVRFPKAGKYTVEIIQGMRNLKLKGIKQVGIKIEKTE